MFQSAHSKAEKAAKSIKAQLHQRIHRKLSKLQPSFNNVSAQKKKMIRYASACQLVEMMDRREVSCVEVVLTFVQRAGTIGVEGNYVLDQMFQEAVNQAKKCDQMRAEHKDRKCWKWGDDKSTTFPPFYGIPISIKQVLLYKNRQTYAGQVHPINPIPTQHGLFVDILLQMGFIPFVRSNVPPACKIIQTVNRMFDYSDNPWKSGRSCGGSSGGEGGMVGSGCAPIGIGTDIGGSLRVPAEWNGLCTMKHGYRYTRSGNCFYGKYSAGVPIKSEIGPITRSVDDLILFSQFIYDSDNYYPSIPRRKHDIYTKYSPFNNSIFQQCQPKLTIGYMKSIQSQYQCSPAHLRVLSQSLQILQSKGHKTKQIKIPQLYHVYQFFMKCFVTDPNLSVVVQPANGQPPIKQYKLMYLLAMLPWFVRFVIIWLIRKKQSRQARLFALTKPSQSKEIIRGIYQNGKKRMRKIYQYVVDQEVDVWLMPGFPVPAINHGDAGKLNYILMHTTVWNAMHYPAGIVPMDLVRPEETHYADGYNDSLTKVMRKQVEGSAGLPVGVQVITYPTNEEQALFVMKEIEREVKFREKCRCGTIDREVVTE